MMTIEQIRDLLADRKLNIIAEKTGIHYNTVRNIANGDGEGASYRTIRVLSDFFMDAKNG